MTNAELLIQTKERLALYIQAEIQVLKGQSYTIGNRALTRADLEDIRKQINELNKDCIKLSRGKGIRTQIVVPRDI